MKYKVEDIVLFNAGNYYLAIIIEIYENVVSKYSNSKHTIIVDDLLDKEMYRIIKTNEIIKSNKDLKDFNKPIINQKQYYFYGKI